MLITVLSDQKSSSKFPLLHSTVLRLTSVTPLLHDGCGQIGALARHLLPVALSLVPSQSKQNQPFTHCIACSASLHK